MGQWEVRNIKLKEKEFLDRIFKFKSESGLKNLIFRSRDLFDILIPEIQVTKCKINQSMYVILKRKIHHFSYQKLCCIPFEIEFMSDSRIKIEYILHYDNK